ncbi:MAG: hypothetical protein MUC36_17255 [Planctomycetes bacterium]|jgi:hypothetical protein|nr:hypothetical protein [Planctomycetota bacterium]
MLSFALGAGAASTGWLVAQLDRGAMPPAVAGADAPRDHPAVETGSPAPPRPAATEGLGNIARRLEALEGKIDALTAAVRSSGERVPIEAATIDENALTTALVRAETRREQQRIEAMSDGELLDEARRLTQKGGAPATAVGLLEQLLARTLEPAQRVEAMTELGMAQRERDPARSIATLQSAIELAGADSPAGAWASFQLIWSAQRQGDHALALGAAEMALRNPGLNAKLRLNARWALASAAIEVGDLNRARSELQCLRDTGGSDPELTKLTADLERRLGGR